MARILRADPDGIAEARALLSAGEVVAFPTETFYGLAADARSEGAVARVFAAKLRPADAPVALIARDLEAVRALSSDALPAGAAAVARTFWPGPVTIVIRASLSIPAALTAGTGTIGVRVSPHPIAAALAEGFPITATSANVSGRPAVRTAAEVAEQLPGIPLVLDGGETPGGLASSVVDLTRDPPSLVREGAVTAEMLRAALPRLR